MSETRQDIPMMPGESLDAAFGEKRGLDAETSKERNSLLLTDRRVIRLSRTNRGVAATFLSLEDVQSAEVYHRPRGVRRLFRMALLLAGAGAALIAVDSAPVAQALAAILGLGAVYHLYQFISVSREGSIQFRATQQELAMPYRGPTAEQAYSLVNRFFHLKSELSNAADTVSDGHDEVERRQRPGRPFSRLQPWGKSTWYETWFLDRSTPVSSLTLRDGTPPDGYETWFLERDVTASGLRPADEPGPSRAGDESYEVILPSNDGAGLAEEAVVAAGDDAEEADSNRSEPSGGG